jgi:hypothetical protein
MCMGVVPLEIKRPRSEANHSFPPSAEVKNVWGCTSFLVGLHGLVLNQAQGQFYFALLTLYSHTQRAGASVFVCGSDLPGEGLVVADLRKVPGLNFYPETDDLYASILF